MNARQSSEALIRRGRLATCGLVACVLFGNLFGSVEGQQTESDRLINAQQLSNSGSASHENQSFESPPKQASEKKEVKQLTLTSRFHLVSGSRKGVLILKAQIPKGSYIYALTQEGNPPPSKISVVPSDLFRLGNEFTADRHPKVIESDPVFNARLQKHTKDVQFFIPIELANGVDPANVKPDIVFDGQVCSEAGTCMPINKRRVSAKFAGYFERETKKQADSQNIRR